MRRETEQCKPPAAGSEGIGCVSAAGGFLASGPRRTGIRYFCPAANQTTRVPGEPLDLWL